MKKRGNRDEMVIATKYSTNFKAGPAGQGKIVSAAAAPPPLFLLQLTPSTN